jgi:DNA-binding NarL/FixJ family response regulator
MSEPIRLLLADDQSLFREGLQTLLSASPDIDVVGEAGNGEEAVRLAVQLRPDVILMDLRMPVMDGVSATRRIKSTLPDTKVIVLTTFDEDKDIFEGLRAGATGYLLKDVSSGKLLEAIRAAFRGEYFLQPSITARVVSEFTRLSKPEPAQVKPLAEPLSGREIEILMLVAEGLSNKEIADKLVIAEGTVKNHLTNILGKLEAKDRMQAVIKARKVGLLA